MDDAVLVMQLLPASAGSCDAEPVAAVGPGHDHPSHRPTGRGSDEVGHGHRGDVLVVVMELVVVRRRVGQHERFKTQNSLTFDAVDRT
jgi:hypothetical protein